MSASCTNSEPLRFTAGETVSWTKSDALFPAGDNTLKYALQTFGKALITIEAAASGSDYLVSLDAATTGDYAPGLYTWTAYIEGPGGNPRTIVGRGTLQIQQSPLQAYGATHASRMLALIETALEGRIENGLESTEIDGQHLQRIPVVDLQRLRDKYFAKVQLERTAAAQALGQRRRSSIGIRFVRPR